VSERPGPGSDGLLPPGLLGVLGGPGRRLRVPARAGRVLVPLVLLASLPVILAVTRQGYCLQHGWDGTEPLWRQCYSDLATSTETGGVTGGLTAYLSSTGGVHVDQPVITGAVMSLLGGLAPGSGAGQQRWYVALWAMLAMALLAAMVWFVATTRRVRADPAQVALAPVVALTVLLSPDIVGVALTTAGVWAWSRRRPTLTGVLLGLAVMARSYPLVVLVAVVALAVREGRAAELRRLGRALAATVGAVLVLWLVTDPGAIGRPYAAWWGAGAGLGSVWYLFTIVGLPISGTALSVIAVLGWLAASALVVLALGSSRRPALGPLLLVGVGVVLLTGKSFPVQSSLWLVPLVAVAGISWRDHLWWGGAEVLHGIAVWLYVAGLAVPDRSLPGGWYGVFVLLRLLGVGYLVWRAWEASTAGLPLGRAAPPLHPPEEWAAEPAAEPVTSEPAGTGEG